MNIESKYNFKIEFSSSDIEKATKIVKNIETIAIKNKINIIEDLKIDLIEVENTNQISIYPTFHLDKNEKHDGVSFNFHGDYLKAYANEKDIYLDLLEFKYAEQ